MLFFKHHWMKIAVIKCNNNNNNKKSAQSHVRHIPLDDSLAHKCCKHANSKLFDDREI